MFLCIYLIHEKNTEAARYCFHNEEFHSLANPVTPIAQIPNIIQCNFKQPRVPRIQYIVNLPILCQVIPKNNASKASAM